MTEKPSTYLAHISKLDFSATPNYNGKPLHPWIWKMTCPVTLGGDVTDYFNYEFDEFSWTAYCQKQTNLRDEFSPTEFMEQMMMIGQFPPGMAGPCGLMDDAATAICLQKCLQ